MRIARDVKSWAYGIICVCITAACCCECESTQSLLDLQEKLSKIVFEKDYQLNMKPPSELPKAKVKYAFKTYCFEGI